MMRGNILTGSTFMRAGVRVFPCQEGGTSIKAPYTRRGFKDGTTDQLIANVWSLKYPGAVWGMPCALNGILVLDADRHGKGDGVGNIMALLNATNLIGARSRSSRPLAAVIIFISSALMGWVEPKQNCAMQWTFGMMPT